MASANGPSTSAAAATEPPQHTSQFTQDGASSIVPADLDASADQNIDHPVKSLFGPFPSSSQHQEAIEPMQTTLPPSINHEELSNIAKSFNDEPSQSFIPPSDGPSDPIQLNQISNLHRSSLPPLTREKTAPAIGPATDKPTPVPKEADIDGPVLYITLLLSSTGARHPYRLDEKYLRKRNVAVDGNNPINISLYKLKELILRDWRDGKGDSFLSLAVRIKLWNFRPLTMIAWTEWEAKPSSPDSIRLISMGKMLNDKARLCGTYPPLLLLITHTDW